VDAAAASPDSPFISAQIVYEMTLTSELLAGVQDVTEVLRRLANRARDITAADYAAIATFDEHDQLHRFVYSGISDEDARRLGRPPSGRGLLGELVRHDRPIRVVDLQQHPLYTGWPPGHPDMCAFLGVPIRAAGRTIGSLYMTRIRGQAPFSDEDEALAAITALQAATSLSVALAHERKDRLNLLEERARIAHDLHDGTIQSLYALGLEVEGFAARNDISESIRAELLCLVGRINDIIGDIRSYITMLEAEAPDGAPELARDLAFIVRRAVPEGIDTVINITAPALQELRPREVEDLLYIAREAISNAVRHSGATKIAVDLRQSPEELALTVQDNGVGYDPGSARAGLGTVTMRTRAERLGGRLNVLSIPGMGTTVRVLIPRGQDDD
jgi:signal transduction histidine kinase